MQENKYNPAKFGGSSLVFAGFEGKFDKDETA